MSDLVALPDESPRPAPPPPDAASIPHARRQAEAEPFSWSLGLWCRVGPSGVRPFS